MCGNHFYLCWYISNVYIHLIWKYSSVATFRALVRLDHENQQQRGHSKHFFPLRCTKTYNQSERTFFVIDNCSYWWTCYLLVFLVMDSKHQNIFSCYRLEEPLSVICDRTVPPKNIFELFVLSNLGIAVLVQHFWCSHHSKKFFYCFWTLSYSSWASLRARQLFLFFVCQECRYTLQIELVE
jgi:hypothetical protein